MKIRSAFRASLGTVLLASALLTSSALADTGGEVELGGTVDSSLAIIVTPTSEASDLSLEGTAGAQIVMVADVQMTTNNSAGLTLTATSGSLTNPSNVSIAYQVTSVAHSAAAPASGDFLISSGSDYTVATSVAGASTKDLYIKYTRAAAQDPGLYGGTITLTSADN